jgi:hypothetical protein
MRIDHSTSDNGTASTQTSHTRPGPQSRGTPLPRSAKPFTPLYNPVIERYLATLKGCKLSVYVALLFHDNDEHDCHPGVRRLAAETGYTPRQVQRGLRELEALGLIASIPRTHDWGDPDTNRYIPLMPPPGPRPPRRSRHAPAGVVPDRHGVVPHSDRVVTSMSGGVVTSMSPGVVTPMSPEQEPFNQIPRNQNDACVCVPSTTYTHTHEEGGQGKASKGGERPATVSTTDSDRGDTCPQCGKAGYWNAAKACCDWCTALAAQLRLDAKRAQASAGVNGWTHGGLTHGTELE